MTNAKVNLTAKDIAIHKNIIIFVENGYIQNKAYSGVGGYHLTFLFMFTYIVDPLNCNGSDFMDI